MLKIRDFNEFSNNYWENYHNAMDDTKSEFGFISTLVLIIPHDICNTAYRQFLFKEGKLIEEADTMTANGVLNYIKLTQLGEVDDYVIIYL